MPSSALDKASQRHARRAARARAFRRLEDAAAGGPFASSSEGLPSSEPAEELPSYLRATLKEDGEAVTVATSASDEADFDCEAGQVFRMPAVSGGGRDININSSSSGNNWEEYDTEAEARAGRHLAAKNSSRSPSHHTSVFAQLGQLSRSKDMDVISLSEDLENHHTGRSDNNVDKASEGDLKIRRALCYGAFLFALLTLSCVFYAFSRQGRHAPQGTRDIFPFFGRADVAEDDANPRGSFLLFPCPDFPRPDGPDSEDANADEGGGGQEKAAGGSKGEDAGTDAESKSEEGGAATEKGHTEKGNAGHTEKGHAEKGNTEKGHTEKGRTEKGHS